MAATRAGNPKLHEKLSKAERWGEEGRRQKEEGERKERRQETGQGRRSWGRRCFLFLGWVGSE